MVAYLGCPIVAEDWPAGPAEPSLPSGEVHLWQADLDALPDFRRCLSPDELVRADRLLTTELRQRFVGGRGLLRTVLARYLGTEPAAVQFGYGQAGKPMLTAEPSLRFNLSHSGRLALLAIARDLDIGVDVERIRPIAEMEHIASQFFAPNESRILSALPPEQRDPAFFTCWTRKEAIVKCLGEGLSHALDSFEVSFAAGEPARVRFAANPELQSWWLANIDILPGYTAAIAAQGPPAKLSTFIWRPC